jgi:hypothetical protein
MKKQELEITIAPNGEVSFTVKGVKGAGCLDATAFLEAALGGKVLDRERTAEYYEQGDGVGATQSVGGDDD